MNCIIIEDQPPAQRILKKYIEDIGSLELKATFANAIEAMDFLRVSPIDVIFLDIHLPKMSGLDFLKSLPQPPAIILTTAFPDYALESYELDVVDYLLKPFSFPRFVKAVSKIPVKTTEQTANHQPGLRKEIFIKSGYEYIKVSLDELLYIKSDADYTEIHLHKKRHLSSESLRHWVEQLPAHFYRLHKSYIINTHKIEKIVGNQVYLQHGVIIPIGRAYREAFMSRFLT
jgi:DNA-binding LytR/AlgR family response regulator